MDSEIDINQLDALKFLSETHRNERNQRRKSQAQGFYTTMSFYGILAASRFSDDFKLPEENKFLFNLGIWILIIIVAFFSSIYLFGLHAQNKVNRELAQNAEDKIREMVNLRGPTKTGKLIAQDRYWQIVIITAFAIATGVSLTCF